MVAASILVVDDDQRLCQLVATYLRRQGWVVMAAKSIASADKLLAQFSFDAMVLDIMMPEEDGLSWAERTQKKPDRPPILFLSARDGVDDRIKGLEFGAEDYLVKPFEPKELALRLQRLIKRQGASDAKDKISAVKSKDNTKPQEPRVTLGQWQYDPHRQEVRWVGEGQKNQAQTLNKTECLILDMLIAQAGVPLSRDRLFDNLDDADNIRTVDMHMTRLRRKIEDDPKNPRIIRTVRGVGYVLVLPAS